VKSIPIALQADFDEKATVKCRLLRIAPRNAAAFGFASTNVAVTYDDGAGSLTYQVASGFDSSAVVSTRDTTVDNAEARILLQSGTPFTEAEIVAGLLDGSEYTVYEVNYARP